MEEVIERIKDENKAKNWTTQIYVYINRKLTVYEIMNVYEKRKHTLMKEEREKK